MAATVPVERRWHLVMAEGVSDIVWPISTLTRMNKHRASEHLWRHLIASFRVRAKLSRTRTNASGLDVSYHVVIGQVEAPMHG